MRCRTAVCCAGSDTDRVSDWLKAAPPERDTRCGGPSPLGDIDEGGGEVGEWVLADMGDVEEKLTSGFSVSRTGSGHHRARSLREGSCGSSSTWLTAAAVRTVAEMRWRSCAF